MTKRNNNKNKEDNVEENDNINSNNNKQDEDIDMVEVDESKSLKGLSVIAKSYNLKQSGRKSEIIERINKYIKEYKEKREKNNIIKLPDELSVKFIFSSKLNDLTIKDISNGELLFWKVFKNKVLFKKITSNFSDDRFHSYNGITKVSWMLENNHINLLFDKLKRDQPLIINEQNQLLVMNQTKHKWYEPIFKKYKSKKIQCEKDESEIGILGNKEFYQLLFKRFSNYIYCPKKLLHSAIACGCLPAVQVILEYGYYQFEPISVAPPSEYIYKRDEKKVVVKHTKQSLITLALLKSFKYIKFPIFQYIYTNELVQSSPNLNGINQSFKEFQTKGIYGMNVGTFQFLNYFLKLGILNNIEFDQNIEQLVYHVQRGFNQTYYSDSLFKYYSFSQLITACEALVQYKSDKQKNLTLDEIQTIKHQYNQKQLESNPMSLLFQLSNDQNNNKENKNNNLIMAIKKLVEFYHQQIPSIKYSILYYYIFEIPLPDDLISSNNSDEFLRSLEYGNYELLIHIINNQNHTCLIQMLCSIFEDTNSNVLFKYCKDPKKKILFIKGLVVFLKSNLESKSTKKIYQSKVLNPFIVLFALIGNDDIEMVQLFIDEIGIDWINTTVGNVYQDLCSNYFGGYCEVLSPTKIQRHIKSIEMLEFCFKNLRNHFNEKKKGILIWYLYGRIDLLERFEQLIGDDQHESLLLPISMIGVDYLYENNTCVSFNKLLKTIVYIIKKPLGMYKYDNSIFKYFDLMDKKQDVNDIINIIQYSDQSLKFNFVFGTDFQLGFKNRFTCSAIQLFEWLFTFNDGIQIKSGRATLYRCHYTALALTNRIDKDITIYHNSDWYKFGPDHNSFTDGNSFTNIHSHGFIEISRVVIKTGDIKLLDILFNHFFIPSITTNEECIEKVNDFIIGLIDNQWIHCVQYIYYNYNRFLTRKNNSNNGLNTLDNLKKLVIQSMKSSEFDIFNFLLNVVNIPFTSKQFHSFFKIKSNEATRNLVYHLSRNNYTLD